MVKSEDVVEVGVMLMVGMHCQVDDDGDDTSNIYENPSSLSSSRSKPVVLVSPSRPRVGHGGGLVGTRHWRPYLSAPTANHELRQTACAPRTDQSRGAYWLS